MIKLTRRECLDSAKKTLKGYREWFNVRNIEDAWQWQETSVCAICTIHVRKKFKVLRECDGEEWYEYYRVGKQKVFVCINYGYNKNRSTNCWEFYHTLEIEKYNGD